MVLRTTGRSGSFAIRIPASADQHRARNAAGPGDAPLLPEKRAAAAEQGDAPLLPGRRGRRAPGGAAHRRASPSTRLASISTVSPPSRWIRIQISDLRGCARNAFSDVASTDSAPPEPTATTSTIGERPELALARHRPGDTEASRLAPALPGTSRSATQRRAARSPPTHEIRTSTAPLSDRTVLTYSAPANHSYIGTRGHYQR